MEDKKEVKKENIELSPNGRETEEFDKQNDAELKPEDNDTLSDDLEKATPEAEIQQLKDRLLRALAENENLIRRSRKERDDATKYAAANFARDMLSIADNLTRAIDSAPNLQSTEEGTVDGLIEGVKLTEKQLLGTLERHGVVKISSEGEKFNHEFHEALFEVPTEEVEAGIIMQVIEDGYMMHDRLLRPARVGVAKEINKPQNHEVKTKDESNT